MDLSHPPRIANSDVTVAMIGLLALGKPDFDTVEPLREDPFFIQSLGLTRVPGGPTLRQRLDQVQGRFDQILRMEPAQVVRRLAPKITPCQGELWALDIDVSPVDNSATHKQGVSFTYKGFTGYALIFAYLGEEGYLADVELRPGTTHCQNGTASFLKRSIRYARMMAQPPLLVRMDGGNDSLENIKACREAGVEWLIKRNPRRESEEEWLKVAQEEGDRDEGRPGEEG
jgi:hypothetical protein